MSTKATTVADFGTSNILLVAVAALAIWILIKKLTTKPSTRNKVTGLTAIKKPAVTGKKYTRKEVAEHNSAEDCWLIIKNKVYDVTTYVSHHPGGEKIFINAGNDNTDGFYGEQHPTTVEDLVSQYYIGDLAD
jgi:cytochrome b involved in lipid metabolism